MVFFSVLDFSDMYIFNDFGGDLILPTIRAVNGSRLVNLHGVTTKEVKRHLTTYFSVFASFEVYFCVSNSDVEFVFMDSMYKHG